jgi:hypothetical protein
MTAFDRALFLKATADEEAYNAFMRAYGDMMRGRSGLFATVPDAKRGQDPYGQEKDEWKYLEDMGIWYNSETGEAFKETYLEDEDEYDQTQIDIPTPVGAGLEGKVFRIPQTEFVAKIPMPRMSSRVRGMAEGSWDKVMRAPLEAWWSRVLSRQYPVNPYSVFASRHPLDQEYSLNMVAPHIDRHEAQSGMGSYYAYGKTPMNAIHEHLFDMRDIGTQWDDLQYEIEGAEAEGDLDAIRSLAEHYPLTGDPDIPSNIMGDVVIDYLSNKPFVEDTHGGLLSQQEIDGLLAAALHEQQNVPKRYRKFGGKIDERIQTIIDELVESQKQGRLVGSSINFADDRNAVGFSDFGRAGQ